MSGIKGYAIDGQWCPERSHSQIRAVIYVRAEAEIVAPCSDLAEDPMA